MKTEDVKSSVSDESMNVKGGMEPLLSIGGGNALVS